MTISDNDRKNTSIGNGSTTVFVYDFSIDDDDDLKVQLKNTTTNVYTPQIKTTHYTVAGVGESAGGTITFITAPTSLQKVVLEGRTPVTQDVDYTENDPFPAETHEGALDKLTSIVQEAKAKIDNSLQLGPDITGVSGVLAAVTATHLIRINGFGTGLETVSPSEFEASLAGAAPLGATFITQTSNTTLTNEQALSLLTTGLVKVTTGTGVLSTGVNGVDYVTPARSFALALIFGG